MLYELYIDSGTLGSSFTKVSNYLNNAMSFTLTTADNNIQPGMIYTFKYIAKNIVGYSAFSTEVRYATATPPSKPAVPTKNLQSSTLTSISVQWS